LDRLSEDDEDGTVPVALADSTSWSSTAADSGEVEGIGVGLVGDKDSIGTRGGGIRGG